MVHLDGHRIAVGRHQARIRGLEKIQEQTRDPDDERLPGAEPRHEAMECHAFRIRKLFTSLIDRQLEPREELCTGDGSHHKRFHGDKNGFERRNSTRKDCMLETIEF